jgi:hypothetical protein
MAGRVVAATPEKIGGKLPSFNGGETFEHNYVSWSGGAVNSEKEHYYFYLFIAGANDFVCPAEISRSCLSRQ